MSRRSKTRDRMRKLVEQWHDSGESMAAFARRHAMGPQKLSYWRRVLGESETGKRRTRVVRPSPSFVPVQVVGASAAGAVEILLGVDCRVVVREGASRDLIAHVVGALRQSC